MFPLLSLGFKQDNISLDGEKTCFTHFQKKYYQHVYMFKAIIFVHI